MQKYKQFSTRDAHGPGRADLSRPAGQPGRKRAEILPSKKEDLHEKTKIYGTNIIKFTFHNEIFLKLSRASSPNSHFLSRLSLLYFILMIVESNVKFLLYYSFQLKYISTGRTGRAEAFYTTGRTGPKKFGPVRTSISDFK